MAGDCIHLNIRLDPHTRLTIATQGSTRVYKYNDPLPPDGPSSSAPSAIFQFPSSTAPPSTASRSISRQDLRVRIAVGAALWLAPDPLQPFAGSRYAQTQIFEVERGGSVGLVDWVTEGRSARGESWAMDGWRGRNEIWEVKRLVGKGSASVAASDSASASTSASMPRIEPTTEKAEPFNEEEEQKTLQIRDSLILQRNPTTGLIPSLSPSPSSFPRTPTFGIIGTLILHGPLFNSLSTFFCSEFSLLPRIGGRTWDDDDHPSPNPDHPHPNAVRAAMASRRQKWRVERQQREKVDGLLWTAAKVRGGGTTVVKFSAREVEGGRNWLGEMLREEGKGGEGDEKGEEGEGKGMGNGEVGSGKEERGEEEKGIAAMFGEGGMMFLR